MYSKQLLLLVLSLVALTTPALANFSKPPEHGKRKPHHHGAMPPAWAPDHEHMPHHKPGTPGPMPERILEMADVRHKPFPGHRHPPAHAPFLHHGHHQGAHSPMESGKGPHKPYKPHAPAPGHPY